MSILGWIGNAIAGVFTSLGHSILDLLGLAPKPKRVTGADAKEAVNARIRREWLEVGDAQQLKDDGIEYEGEVYYGTVH
jgi:hypothetical protein